MSIAAKLVTVATIGLLLSHCSDEPDIELIGNEVASQVDFAVARVNLAEVCDTVTVQTETGSSLKGKKDCQAMALPSCTEGIKESCILEYNADQTLALVQAERLKPEYIKAGVTIGDIEGALQPEGDFDYCAADGDADCIVSGDLAAARTTGLADKIIAGHSIGGVAGTFQPKSLCAADGELDCVTTASFKAADMSAVSATNIRSGVTIAGQGGTLDAHSDCAADGATGCIATASYVAAKVDNIVAGDLKTTKTIAGITGTLANCSTDGGTNCVAVAAFKAADMSVATASNIRTGVTIAGEAGTVPTYNDCSSNGDTGCIATATFKAAQLSAFDATDIKFGVTIAGVAGTIGNCTANLQGDCLTGTQYTSFDPDDVPADKVRVGTSIAGVGGTLADCSTDGGVGCVTSDDYKAAKMANFQATDIKDGITIAGEVGTVATCAADLESNCITTATYQSFNTAGVTASAVRSSVTIAGVRGKLADCNSDGQNSACVIADGFTAVQSTKLDKGSIKNGTTIGGVLGEYPSETYPLPGHNTSSHVLTGANFEAAIKDGSGSTYEFWDHAGIRQAASTTADLTPENIKNGVTIFGETGTLVGATGAPDTWDVRDGVSINGVTGSLPGNCSTATCDGSAFEDISKLNGVGTTCSNVLPKGDRNIEKDCMYRDRITGLIWTDTLNGNTPDSSTDAATRCSELNHELVAFGGYTSGWRLPTIAELVAFISHGISDFNSRHQNETTELWSSTNYYAGADEKSYSAITSGEVRVHSGTSALTLNTICVRSP